MNFDYDCRAAVVPSGGLNSLPIIFRSSLNNIVGRGFSFYKWNENIYISFQVMEKYYKIQLNKSL